MRNSLGNLKMDPNIPSADDALCTPHSPMDTEVDGFNQLLDSSMDENFVSANSSFEDISPRASDFISEHGSGLVESPHFNFFNLHSPYRAQRSHDLEMHQSESKSLSEVVKSHLWSIQSSEYVTVCASNILSILKVYGGCIPEDSRVINKKSQTMFNILDKLYAHIARMKSGRHWHANADQPTNYSEYYCTPCEVTVPKGNMMIHENGKRHKNECVAWVSHNPKVEQPLGKQNVLAEVKVVTTEASSLVFEAKLSKEEAYQNENERDLEKKSSSPALDVTTDEHIRQIVEKYLSLERPDVSSEGCLDGYYVCRKCNVKLTYDVMLRHVIGKRHLKSPQMLSTSASKKKLDILQKLIAIKTQNLNSRRLIDVQTMEKFIQASSLLLDDSHADLKASSTFNTASQHGIKTNIDSNNSCLQELKTTSCDDCFLSDDALSHQQSFAFSMQTNGIGSSRENSAEMVTRKNEVGCRELDVSKDCRTKATGYDGASLYCIQDLRAVNKTEENLVPQFETLHMTLDVKTGKTLKEEFHLAFPGRDIGDYDVHCGSCEVLFPIYNIDGGEDLDFSFHLHVQNSPQHLLATEVLPKLDPKISMSDSAKTPILSLSRFTKASAISKKVPKPVILNLVRKYLPRNISSAPIFENNKINASDYRSDSTTGQNCPILHSDVGQLDAGEYEGKAAQPTNDSTYYCLLCNVTASIGNKIPHENGKRHRKKLEAWASNHSKAVQPLGKLNINSNIQVLTEESSSSVMEAKFSNEEKQKNENELNLEKKFCSLAADVTSEEHIRQIVEEYLSLEEPGVTKQICLDGLYACRKCNVKLLTDINMLNHVIGKRHFQPSQMLCTNSSLKKIDILKKIIALKSQKLSILKVLNVLTMEKCIEATSLSLKDTHSDLEVSLPFCTGSQNGTQQDINVESRSREELKTLSCDNSLLSDGALCHQQTCELALQTQDLGCGTILQSHMTDKKASRQNYALLVSGKNLDCLSDSNVSKDCRTKVTRKDQVSLHNENGGDLASQIETLVIGDKTGISLKEEFHLACPGRDISDYEVQCGTCGVLFPIYNVNGEGDVDFSFDMHVQNNPQHVLATEMPMKRDPQKMSESCRTINLPRKPWFTIATTASRNESKPVSLNLEGGTKVIEILFSLEQGNFVMQKSNYFCKLCKVMYYSDMQFFRHLLGPVHLSEKWMLKLTDSELLQRLVRLNSLLKNRCPCYLLQRALDRINILISNKLNASHPEGISSPGQPSSRKTTL